MTGWTACVELGILHHGNTRKITVQIWLPTNAIIKHFQLSNETRRDTVPVKVTYRIARRRHESLVHFYSTWYTDYLEADFAWIIIWMEDLVLHARNVTTQVCQCVGGTIKSDFQYIVDSAKPSHCRSGNSSLVDVILRYGKFEEWTSRMTNEDLELAQTALNPKLMDSFGYQVAAPSKR